MTGFSEALAYAAFSVSQPTLPVTMTPHMSDAALELTVLMPCLNEAETLATCIRKARSCIERLGLSAEVLIADNGSTDGSQRIAQSEGARVVVVPERGYGAALYHGARQARGRVIIMGDADDSYDFSTLDAFVEKLREGADLVMGNRFLGGIRPGRHAVEEQVHRQSGVVSGRATLLPLSGSRFSLRPAWILTRGVRPHGAADNGGWSSRRRW